MEGLVVAWSWGWWVRESLRVDPHSLSLHIYSSSIGLAKSFLGAERWRWGGAEGEIIFFFIANVPCGLFLEQKYFTS